MKDVTLSGGMPKRNGVARFVEVNRNRIVEVVSALFILLFVYTALHKFLAYEMLGSVLEKYPLIGNFSNIITFGLPITELSISILLLIPKTRLIGLITSTALMLLFTLYIGYLFLFNSDMPCTCGGMLQELSWPQHIYFNSLFIILGFIGIWCYKMNTLKAVTKSN